MMLMSIILSTIIGMLFKAYFLPIVLRLAAIRSWIYGKLASEEGKAYSEEMQANLPDEIAIYRRWGDSNDVIAAKILFRLMIGLPSDITIWAPSIPALLVGKIVVWSNTLRHYRIPAVLVAGVATLLLMNYSFFSSESNKTIVNWLVMNSIVVVVCLLLWKYKHPLARRIFQAWMGIAIVAGVAGLIWMTIHFQLYTSVTFKILMLAMTALLPVIIVVDKSWRKRLFRGRWWLIPICWTPIIAGTLVSSLLIADSIKPLLEMWAAIALLAVGMLIVYGFIALAAYVLCWLGIRGSAGGLRMAASGIRRLR